MKSKDALEELKFQVGNITYYTHDLQMTTRKVRDSGLFEIIEKDLEMLEQIKKELGIDLVVLFKALKNGIWFKHTSPFLEEEKPIVFSKGWHLNYNEPTDRYFLELGSYIRLIAEEVDYLWEIVELKDYGKTWALTKEELK